MMMRWRRLDIPGQDEARLRSVPGGWHLEGRAEFVEDGNRWVLGYTVTCGTDWATRRAVVAGHSDRGAVEVSMVRSAAGGWTLNRRTSQSACDYAAPDLPFAGILTVNPDGFVLDYAGLWCADLPRGQ